MADITKVLDKKVGSFSLIDGMLIGASKLTSEMFLSTVPFIGNGTYKSGLMKVGTAVLISNFTGNKKVFQVVNTGILIDGMEDIALGVKRQFFNGAKNNGGDAPAFS